MSTPDHASPEGSAVRNTQYASPRTLEIIAVTLVLLLAAYLRLNHLDWTEFKQDEARLSQIAYDMARTGEIPLRSIGASTGVVNLPLAAWLLAIPYAVSGSPIVATAGVWCTRSPRTERSGSRSGVRRSSRRTAASWRWS